MGEDEGELLKLIEAFIAAPALYLIGTQSMSATCTCLCEGFLCAPFLFQLRTASTIVASIIVRCGCQRLTGVNGSQNNVLYSTVQSLLFHP